ncbi:UPF0280 family protein [uncultured Ruegeria sp.]|uniref:UPF0280 family protein n=1 Tax=uncultured Ruegeria sp. TaxID=259304 RepID=UPI002603A2BE|nr:UPF0280 family protein [uncultured Ruegeria sp.]
MRPCARLLPDGQRLHLQHGPSDLIVWAEGERDQAYRAAVKRFETIIAEVVEELPDLRTMLSPLAKRPKGAVARRMHDACLPLTDVGYITRLAAVAGSIADEVLAAMIQRANITRAYVNNGGDIALCLTPGTSFKTSIQAHDGGELGRIEVTDKDRIGGIATSGRQGRSLSLGIADSVTVLASSAAEADVAATLIANAVDLPGHPSVTRRAACDIDENSDLGELPVTVSCGALSDENCDRALALGLNRATDFQAQGRIASAGLFLQGRSVTTGAHVLPVQQEIQHVPT